MQETEPTFQTITTLERERRSSADGEGEAVFGKNLDLIRGVKIRLEVVLGACEMSVAELFELRRSSVVKLDRDVSTPVDVHLNGKRVARGTLVAVDDNFGVKITEMAPGEGDP